MSGLPPLEVLGWRAVDRLVARLALRILEAGSVPDRIVALARGGWVPARLLADHLGVMALSSLRVTHYRGMERLNAPCLAEPLAADVSGERVLVVDDLADTGGSVRVALAHLEGLGAAEVRTAALHRKPGAAFDPDFVAARPRRCRWVAYPWARQEDLAALVQRLGLKPEETAPLLARAGLKVTPAGLARAQAVWQDP